MSLEVVLESILKKGEEVRRKTIEAGVEEAKKIEKEAQTQAKAEEEEAIAEAKRQIDTRWRQELSSAKIERKKKILNTEKKVLDTFYQKTLEEMKNLPETTNQRLLSMLVVKAKDAMAGGTIYCRAEDADLIDSKEFEVRGELTGIGGIIVEGEEKIFTLDLTYESLLADIWADSVKKLFELFSES